MSQQDDALTDQETNDQTSADESQQDDEFSLVDDTRASIYDKIDRANAENRDSVDREGFFAKPEDESDAPSEDEQPLEEGETKEPEGTVGEQETVTRRVMTREEFEKEFANIDLKMKVAGEEVVAPAREFVKAHGLEKHLTKKMQEFYKKEKEILDKYLHESPDGDGSVDEEVQAKYDELFEESPAKAAKYLQELNQQKSTKQEERVKAHLERAVADFRSLYPDCTDADWEAMNKPDWYNKHEDILELRQKGDVFGTLITAYARLRESQATQPVAEPKATTKEQAPAKAERKKAGQVIRTAIKPTQADKKVVKVKSKAELNREYILERQNAAKARMGLKD